MQQDLINIMTRREMMDSLMQFYPVGIDEIYGWTQMTWPVFKQEFLRLMQIEDEYNNTTFVEK